MEAIIFFILKTAWYALPMGLANMLPLIFRKWCRFLAFPIDGHRLFRGQPVFGPNKTWRGLLVGIMGGALMLVIQKHAYANSDFFRDISVVDYSVQTAWLGALMGFGAVLGDLVKSFFKRRVGRSSGASWFPLDQLDYVLGGMLLSFFLFIPPAEIVAAVLVLGVLEHIGVTMIAKFIGLRRGGW